MIIKESQATKKERRNNLVEIKDKLAKERKRLGLSQEELAEKLSVSRQTISKWENGECLPDAYNLMTLSDIFEVSVDYLLHGECLCDTDTKLGKSLKLEAFKKNRRIGAVLLIAGLLGTLTIFFLSRIMYSNKIIAVPMTQAISTETGLISEIAPDQKAYVAEQVKEFTPFLDTYSLWIPFAMLLSLILIGAILFIFSSKKIRSIKSIGVKNSA